MEAIEGIALEFIYKAEDSNFAILKFSDDKEKIITAKGLIGDIEVGENISLKGDWNNDKQYGLNFIVKEYETVRPTSINGIKLYLVQNIKGIGPSLAEKIVAKYGEKALSMIEKDPSFLLDFPGISEKKLKVIIKEWEEKQKSREYLLTINSYGIGRNLAMRIYQQWQDKSIDIIKENPYRLTEIDRIGFQIADDVAKKMGIAINDPRRIDAGIIFVLQQSRAKEGHVFLTLAQLLTEARNTLRLEEKDAALVSERVKNLNKQRKVTVENSYYSGERRVYLNRMWLHEQRLALKIRLMLEDKKTLGYAEKPNKEITDQQWQAVEVALQSKLSILTGNPGTGKTTACKVLCQTIDNLHYKIALAAPTGKAAKRMSEATGFEATTIHRLLEWKVGEGFTYDAQNTLPYDVIILDETSMLDLVLADQLFAAIATSTHVVIVGDVDQLPSVGAGRVLHDLINCHLIPVTKLSKVFRQARKSMIIQAAYSVNRGKIPQDDPDKATLVGGLTKEEIIRDFYWLKRDSNQEIVSWTVEYAAKRIPQKYGYDPINDIQVLAPQRNTNVGVDALNIALQATLNPQGQTFGKKGYRLGDKLLNTINNYEHDIMNGEFAIIKKINEEDKTVVIESENREIELGFPDVENNFVLAYATTIHKMQGSQAKAIIVPMSTSYYNLNRNLLYTAITRAEKVCMIIGSVQSVGKAVNERSLKPRNSSLAERLKHPNLGGQLI